MKINFLAHAFYLHIEWELFGEAFGESEEAMNLLHASASMWILCYQAMTPSPKKWALQAQYPQY